MSGPPDTVPAWPPGPPTTTAPNAPALFEAANKLRGSVESAEYKHLVLGLLFLKYISDSFVSARGDGWRRSCATRGAKELRPGP